MIALKITDGLFFYAFVCDFFTLLVTFATDMLIADGTKR